MQKVFPNSQDMNNITNIAVDILSDIGIEIQNQTIIKKLVNNGLKQDINGRVIIPKSYTVDFLNQVTPKFQPLLPSVTAYAELYEGNYLDVFDNKLKPWTRELLLLCVKLSHRLSNIDGATMLGYPLSGIDRKNQMLEERLFCWQYGISSGGALWDIEQCQSILNLYKAYADLVSKPLEDVFSSHTYLISPLKWAKQETEQFL